jgi:hypothetical protein
MIRFQNDVANRRPSGEKVTQFTKSLCPCRSATQAPLLLLLLLQFHTRTLPSPKPAASSSGEEVLAGENATRNAAPKLSPKLVRLSPERASSSRMPSCNPTASCCPSGVMGIQCLLFQSEKMG